MTQKKWMLVAALFAVNGYAIALPQAHPIESVAEMRCRAPLHCVPPSRPNLKPPPSHGPPPSVVSGVLPRDGSVQRVGDAHNAPGSGGTTNGSNNSPGPKTFTCGEVVGGVTIPCTTTPPNKPPVSAPEIDTSGAVSGTMFVMGCLAILHARRRRPATLTGRPSASD
jgi:hypothetical protein